MAPTVAVYESPFIPAKTKNTNDFLYSKFTNSYQDFCCISHTKPHKFSTTADLMRKIVHTRDSHKRTEHTKYFAYTPRV